MFSTVYRYPSPTDASQNPRQQTNTLTTKKLVTWVEILSKIYMWPSSVGFHTLLGLRVTHPRPTLGAGIAGLALAIALHKKGVSFTLYEEAKEYSVVG